MESLAQLDQEYVWHPFTQMQDWMRDNPMVIVSGKGASLKDSEGRSYLDANASIWTNLHGHRHPRMNRAIRNQLNRIAHSSALGLANEPASLLGEKLVRMVKQKFSDVSGGTKRSKQPELTKVFYSDDGSTAMEAALKMTFEYARRTGLAERPRFLSLSQAYHGDTVGAVSVGQVDLFHRAFRGMLFEVDKVMSPYCYRCPFNRAKPQRVDARETRRCGWECVDEVEKALEGQVKKKGEAHAGMVIEPIIQGVAGIVAHPRGWLKKVAQRIRQRGTLFIADEVMTGFGRTGSWFGSHREGVQPDIMALAKGLTGGYLPMAATLVKQSVFDVFLGEYEDFKSFFHGHSYTGNQLGAAAALESMALLEEGEEQRLQLERWLARELEGLWDLKGVGDVRREGLVVGVELVRDWKTREPFDWRERMGIRVCEGMRRRGVLTRPIGNVIPLIPPYCFTETQTVKMVRALKDSILEVFRD